MNHMGVFLPGECWRGGAEIRMVDTVRNGVTGYLFLFVQDGPAEGEPAGCTGYGHAHGTAFADWVSRWDAQLVSGKLVKTMTHVEYRP